MTSAARWLTPVPTIRHSSYGQRESKPVLSCSALAAGVVRRGAGLRSTSHIRSERGRWPLPTSLLLNPRRLWHRPCSPFPLYTPSACWCAHTVVETSSSVCEASPCLLHSLHNNGLHTPACTALRTSVRVVQVPHAAGRAYRERSLCASQQTSLI